MFRFSKNLLSFKRSWREKKPSLTNSSSRFSFRARDGFNGNEKQVFVRSLESGTKNSKAEYFRIETIVAKKLIAVAQNFFCFQGRSASVRNNSFLNGWKKGQYGIYCPGFESCYLQTLFKRACSSKICSVLAHQTELA